MIVKYIWIKWNFQRKMAEFFAFLNRNIVHSRHFGSHIETRRKMGLRLSVKRPSIALAIGLFWTSITYCIAKCRRWRTRTSSTIYARICFCLSSQKKMFFFSQHWIFYISYYMHTYTFNEYSKTFPGFILCLTGAVRRRTHTV